jgi:hypothetical protein
MNTRIDWLIDFLQFYIPLKNFSLKYGDVAIAEYKERHS